LGRISLLTLEEEDPASAATTSKRPKPVKRKKYFAKRNETFRNAARKSLKSLRAPNQHFAVSFVFNGLTSFSFRAFL
jgi:hypothetical protein